ncbi:tRNA lysidine(34) synthetase TilS [Actinotalea solisilvae]|uniref:tRNA lysidine(34) synthetase TilS n=1 Tax=Actinotalea solisilvae TaxID=2072922 RepID=UPI0018F10E12|nr:tRNA lysidine(34) synthetase TilS [Actinotalea solisilvae]
MTGPDPAVAALRAAVRRELDGVAGGGAGPAPLVLVACSGGPDSLALAAATAFVAPRLGLRAGAVVVDHGLQAGSDAVAVRAAGACRALGLDPVDVVPVAVDVADGGPEAGARSARYAALEHVAAQRGAVAVLLGHTLEDQAETVLLRLARGSGARSLAGMPRRRGLLRRPFLGERRATTERACAALGLDPWHDPTNTPAPAGATSGAAPVRSRVRGEVLPVLADVLGPAVVPSLARTADLLREDDDALAALAADALAAAWVAPDGGVTVPGPAAGDGAGPGPALDVAALAALAPAVRRRALRAALVAWGAPAGDVGRVHVEAVDRLVTDWRGQGGAAVPGGGVVHRRCGRLTCVRPAPPTSAARDEHDEHDQHTGHDG